MRMMCSSLNRSCWRDHPTPLSLGGSEAPIDVDEWAVEVTPPGRTRAALSFCCGSTAFVLICRRLGLLVLIRSASSGSVAPLRLRRLARGGCWGRRLRTMVARSPPPSAVNWEEATPQQRREAGKGHSFGPNKGCSRGGWLLCRGKSLKAVTATAIARVTAAMTEDDNNGIDRSGGDSSGDVDGVRGGEEGGNGGDDDRDGDGGGDGDDGGDDGGGGDVGGQRER